MRGDHSATALFRRSIPAPDTEKAKYVERLCEVDRGAEQEDRDRRTEPDSISPGREARNAWSYSDACVDTSLAESQGLVKVFAPSLKLKIRSTR